MATLRRPVGRFLRVCAQLFKEPRRAQNFEHQAILRGADPRLLDALRNELSLLQFAGPKDMLTDETIARLRQGPSVAPGALLFGVGCACLMLTLVLWSAVPSRLRGLPAGGPVLAGASLVLVVAGVLLARRTRLHVWLVSRRSNHGATDLWIGGSSWRGEPMFAIRFEELVERARKMDLAFGASLDSRRNGTTRRSAFVVTATPAISRMKLRYVPRGTH
jgi:hypothetical protein